MMMNVVDYQILLTYTDYPPTILYRARYIIIQLLIMCNIASYFVHVDPSSLDYLVNFVSRTISKSA